MRHILPILIALATALGILVIRPEASFEPRVTIADADHVFDEAALREEIGALRLAEPADVLVYVGPGEVSAERCEYATTPCLFPLYPDFFGDGEIKDGAYALWVDPGSEFVSVLLPRYTADINTVHEMEGAFAHTLSAHYVRGELDEHMAAQAIDAAAESYHGVRNAAAVERARIIQAILGGLLAGGLAWLIASAISQARDELTYRTRRERRSAIETIRDRFRRASHAIDSIELALISPAITAEWKALYVELTRTMAGAQFLEDDSCSRSRYDALIATLDTASAEVDELSNHILHDAPRPDVGSDHKKQAADRREVESPSTWRTTMPIAPRLIAVAAGLSLLAAVVAGSLTAMAGEPEPIDYAPPPASLGSAMTRRALR